MFGPRQRVTCCFICRISDLLDRAPAQASREADVRAAFRLRSIKMDRRDTLASLVLGDKSVMSAEILEKVKTIVGEQLEKDAAEISPESNFQNDLGADSLDVVELVMALEEEFDIEIPDEAAENIATVQAAVDYIAEKSAAPSA